MSEKSAATNGQVWAGAILCLFGVLWTVAGVVGALIFLVLFSMGDGLSVNRMLPTYGTGAVVLLTLVLGSSLYSIGMLLAGSLGRSRAAAVLLLYRRFRAIGFTVALVVVFVGLFELARGEAVWGGGMLILGLSLFASVSRIVRAIFQRMVEDVYLD